MSWAVADDALAGGAAAAWGGGTGSDNRLNAESTLLGRNGLQSPMIFCRPSTPMRRSSASNRAWDASRIYSDNNTKTDESTLLCDTIGRVTGLVYNL